MGYQSLSGLFAIEFDTNSNFFKGDPSKGPFHIGVMGRNPVTGLLDSHHSYQLGVNPSPANFIVTILMFTYLRTPIKLASRVSSLLKWAL